MEKESKYLFRGKPIDEFNEFREDLDPALDDWKNIIKEDGFIYGSLIWNDGSPFIVGDIADLSEEYIAHEYWCPVKPETVGLFTGIIDDRKDVKLFEDDYVAIVTVTIDGYDIDIDEGVIKWKEGAFHVGHGTMAGYDDGVSFMYLGNIHDNPELLRI